MPIYEYRCAACRTTFESIRPVGDDGHDLACPECGAVGPEKIPSVFATGGGTGSGAMGSGCGTAGFG